MTIRRLITGDWVALVWVPVGVWVDPQVSPWVHAQEQALYDGLLTSSLLWSKGERVNLGKYQHSATVASKTLLHYSQKAYIYNVAALSLGMKGFDRPPEVPVEGPTLEDGAKPTLKQHSKVQQPWNDSCKNQLDRAAMLYGSTENYYKQRLIVQILTPTQEFHGRRRGPSRMMSSSGVARRRRENAGVVVAGRVCRAVAG